MKEIQILTLLVIVTFSAKAQDNNFPSTGNVTINSGHLVQTGTNNNLQTQGSVKLKNYLLFDADGDFTGGNYFTIRDNPTGDYLRLGRGFDNNLIISSIGKIGIGTIDPKGNLQINGTSEASSSSGLNGHLVLSSNTTGLVSTFGLYTSPTNPYSWIQSGHKDNDATYDLALNPRGGNVGIGVTNPTQKLQVAGTVYSTEVKVELAAGQGPDYVFEADYELLTLHETKEYIKKHKHLPEIPSAKEMEANGIELGDMNMRLLKKIEELTLYQIELLERLEKAEKEISELKNK